VTRTWTANSPEVELLAAGVLVPFVVGAGDVVSFDPDADVDSSDVEWGMVSDDWWSAGPVSASIESGEWGSDCSSVGDANEQLIGIRSKRACQVDETPATPRIDIYTSSPMSTSWKPPGLLSQRRLRRGASISAIGWRKRRRGGKWGIDPLSGSQLRTCLSSWGGGRRRRCGLREAVG
jgi:hypothetical protein